MSDPSVNVPEGGEDGMSLVDLLIVLGQTRRIFFGVLTIGLVATCLTALLSQRKYVASTLILPPQQQQSSISGAIAQLGALAGMTGSIGVKSPDEMYVAFLKTRRIQNALIEKFKLESHYQVDSLGEARKELGKNVSIGLDKKAGLISVEVEDKDAALAAKIANAHMEELKSLIGKIAVTDAQQRRVFYEQQVERTKTLLAEAEKAFRLSQLKYGFQVSQALAEGGIRESADIRAQIAIKEIQLQAINRFATPSNFDVQKVSAELSALRRQLQKIEGGNLAAELSNSDQTAVKAYRDLKVQEALLEAFIKQLEIAKFEETKEGPLLQQVDVASVPERATRPRRGLLIAIGAASSAGLALVIAISVGLWQRGRRNQPEKIALLRSAWQRR